MNARTDNLPSVIVKIWAAVGAVFCGIVGASIAGGGLGSLALILLLATVTAAAAVTIATVARQRPSQEALERQWRGTPGPPSPLTERLAVRRVEELTSGLALQDVEWLRVEGFVGPWLDRHVAPFRAIAEISPDDCVETGSFEPVLRRFIQDTAAFVELHEASTMSDPMVLHSAWRVVGRNGPGAEKGDLEDSERRRLERELREAATEVCDSYDALRQAMGRPLSA
jgi:hypothetical protein